MAKVRIDAQYNVPDHSTCKYDLSKIPPLDDSRYVSSYKSTKAYMYISWIYDGHDIDRYYGIIHKVGTTEHCRKTTQGPYEPRGAWREVDITEMMKHVTDREIDTGLTRLDVYYFSSNIRVTDGGPYIEIDFEAIPITVSNPSISNISLSKDKPITLTWMHSGSPQHGYEIRYIDNGDEITKYVESNIQSHTFEVGELPKGKISYKIRLFNGFEWSNWTEEKTFTTYGNDITSIEPNKIAQNKDKPIVVMWSTADTQTQYRLKYKQGLNINTITGTTAKTHAFPANFFGNGTVELTLEIFNGYVWTTKTTEFMAYGAPPNPILTTLDVYDTATPIFTWTASEQVSYRVQVLKDGMIILDSTDIYSSSQKYKFASVLENNTIYTVRLRVKNQYEIESEWVTKTFAATFTELQKPNFDMFSNDKLGAIMFNIYNATGQADFKHCEILRREYGKSEWNKIADNLGLISTYTDFTCKSGILYEYKVRAIGTSGGYADSDIGIKETTLQNTMISDTTDFNNYVVLTHNPKKTRTLIKESHAMQYSGLNSPKFEYGDINYVSISISFKVDEATLKKLFGLYYSNNMLLLRDNRGKQIYGHIGDQISVEDTDFMKYNISFNFIETDYEGVLA